MSHSIILIGVWFGPWPTWIDFFFTSCQSNSDIDWLIFSDQPPPESAPKNVKIVQTSFLDYKEFVGSKLSITVHEEANAYKMCDFRPAFGYIHYEYIRDYDFFGFTDFDVIYGLIRSFYDKDVLDRYDALATHTWHLSGHLFLMRNTREMRNAFMCIPNWRETLQKRMNDGFDEREFYKYFRNGRSRRSRLVSLGRRRPFLFREAYSTPMPTTDMRWYWKDGLLSNEFYPKQFFLYLHFMTWQSNKWFRFISNISPGAPAPWQDRTDVVQMDWRRGRDEGFMISPVGIQAIELRTYP